MQLFKQSRCKHSLFNDQDESPQAPHGEKNLARSTSSCATLNKIIHEHDAALRRFVRVRQNRKEDCEDIVQEVYTKLSQQGDLDTRFAERQDTVRSYLFRIADNLMIDLSRRAKVRKQAFHVSEQNVTILSSIHCPERCLEGHRQLQQINHALLRLRPLQRQAFILHRVEGLSYRQISNNLEVSVSTVEKYIASALVQLRAMVKL